MAVGTTAAILGATGIGANLFSGMMGARAAKKGAAAQTQAGYDASQYVLDATNPANQALSEAGNNASQGVLDAAEGGAVGVLNAQQAAANGVDAATAEANTHLNPYINQGQTSLGTLGELLSPGGRYTQLMDEKFNFDPANDPSYQFVFEQGQKALERSAAARGGALGGGAAKALARYGSGMASQEFSRQVDRFQSDKMNRAGILNGMAGQLQNVSGMGLQAGTTAGNNTMGAAEYRGNTGMQAEQYAGDRRFAGAQYSGNMQFNTANQIGQNSINAAQYQGNARMGIGNAQAAGHIGAANAWGSAMNGAVNSAMNGVVLGSTLRPRAALPNPVPASAYLTGGVLNPGRHTWNG